MNPLQPWQAKGRFGPNDVHHQVKLTLHGVKTEENLHDYFLFPNSVFFSFSYRAVTRDIKTID